MLFTFKTHVSLLISDDTQTYILKKIARDSPVFHKFKPIKYLYLNYYSNPLKKFYKNSSPAPVFKKYSSDQIPNYVMAVNYFEESI